MLCVILYFKKTDSLFQYYWQLLTRYMKIVSLCLSLHTNISLGMERGHVYIHELSLCYIQWLLVNFLGGKQILNARHLFSSHLGGKTPDPTKRTYIDVMLEQKLTKEKVSDLSNVNICYQWASFWHLYCFKSSDNKRNEKVKKDSTNILIGWERCQWQLYAFVKKRVPREKLNSPAGITLIISFTSWCNYKDWFEKESGEILTLIFDIYFSVALPLYSFVWKFSIFLKWTLKFITPSYSQITNRKGTKHKFN